MNQLFHSKLLIFTFLLSFFCTSSVTAQKKNKKNKSAEKTEQKEKHYLDTLSIGLKFRSIGPALTSGRIADIAVHPENRSLYYIATASGGVWKTTNAGTTFSSVFDRQGSYSMGCVTIDPNNYNVVWVGSGENNNQRSVAYGDGIYKSEDGGATWKNMGLKNSEHIAKIIVHPENSNIVYVAALGPLWSEGGDRGVYKTVDGGQNWEAVLSIDEHTGITDLVIDPRNPDVLYAAAHQRRRHVFTYVGGGPGSGIYKTTNGGANWEKANQGLPKVDLGRIGLAISPANPEIIYAMVEAAQGKGGFFRSTNRGASWQKQNSYSTSGNYYIEIVAHPTKEDVVYAMDTWMHYTEDGGKSFSRVGEEYKHVDNHSMWIDPKDPNYFLVGCDGGIYESFDAGQYWKYIDNLPITQFYKVAVDNDVPFYNVYGGTQDNFSLGGPSRTRSQNGIVNADWVITNGGDGFESQVDPNNPNIIYAQSQYGVLFRYDRASGERMGIQPKPREGEDQYRWNWDAPLHISSHQGTRLYFAANKLFRTNDRGNSWEVISEDLSRQVDRNKLEVMGRIQSMDAVSKNGATSPYGTIVAFSESPLDENLLFVGTDDGLIQITQDGGQSWETMDVNTISGAPQRTYVNALLASQHDKNVVYAVFNHHKYGDFKPYVYKSTDKGKSWVSISSNLPERGSGYSIAEDHIDQNLLFVGTEFGCFATVDGGGYWKQLKSGLPTIAVRDIAIQTRENDLVLATFGRGFYILDDYSPLRQVKQDDLAMDAKIFPIKDGLIFIPSVPLGLRGNGFMGHSYFSTPNPPVGVTFTYYLKEGYQTLQDQRRKKEKEAIKENEPLRYPTYEELKAEQEEESPYLEFTIRDLSDNIVRKLKTNISKGIHQIVWDGRYVSIRPVSLGSPPDNIFGNADAGTLVMPGDYTVSLSQSINGELTQLVAPTKFKLNTLGGVTLPAENRARLVEFQREAQELQRAVSGTSRRISEINTQLRHMRKAVEATPTSTASLTSDLQAIDKQLNAIQLAMFGDRLASRLDQGSPMSIAGRIGWITGEMWNTTSEPTKTQKEGLRIAKANFTKTLEEVKSVQRAIERLEEKLEKAGAPYTPGRSVELGEH